MPTAPGITRQILSLHCHNRPGIVAAVATFLRDAGGDIIDAQQFDDATTGRFFMRVVVRASGERALPSALENSAAFESIGSAFQMKWTLRDSSTRKRVMLLVSRFDHCLVDLLYRRSIGELAMDVAAIVSNHPIDRNRLIGAEEIPCVHLPASKETRAAQETELYTLVEQCGADLVVLARYMQILSDNLSSRLAGRCINIHHSFLPGFKGAKPYHQAHERGVKLIGATAHFVTPDLDEGPIIAQDVEHISHRDTADDLIRKGREIEQRVLARAVSAVLDDRVMLNGGKTIVFAP